MDLDPLHRTTVADAAFGQLLAQILDGDLAPGDELPGERALGERLGVNRQAVREARKRLDQAGLVAVRHGSRSTVLDPRRAGGADLLAPWVANGDALDRGLVLDVLEVRAALGPEVAQLAARRATPEAVAELDRLVVALADRAGSVADRPRARLDPATAVDLAAIDRRWWHVLVDAAGNLAHRLVANSVLAAVDAALERCPDLLAAETTDVAGHRRVVAAVAAGAEAPAVGAARRLLDAGLAAAPAALGARR